MDPRTGTYVAQYLLRYGSLLLGLGVLLTARKKAGYGFVLLTLFQAAGMWRLQLAHLAEKPVLAAVIGLGICQWVLFLYAQYRGKSSSREVLLAAFLSTLGLLILWELRPQGLSRQVTALGLGIVGFLVTERCLASPARIQKLGPWAAGAAVFLLGAGLLLGKPAYGARNWLQLGPVAFQPAEPVKVLYILAAMGLEAGSGKRQLLFLLFTLGVCGLLVCMNDLGTAAIFAMTYFVVTWGQRLPVTGLAAAAFGTAAFGCVRLAPHALRRLEHWRHIWASPYGAGYQQTQGLMCLASGGLLGLGPGSTRMKGVFAAASDMVFVSVGEIWGLGLAVVMVVALMQLAGLSLQETGTPSHLRGRCGAAAILLTQTALHVLGSVDLLPMTGVTLPFVSAGGSSMVSCWCLLSCLRVGREA